MKRQVLSQTRISNLRFCVPNSCQDISILIQINVEKRKLLIWKEKERECNDSEREKVGQVSNFLGTAWRLAYLSWNFITKMPRDFYWIKFQSQAVNTPAKCFLDLIFRFHSFYYQKVLPDFIFIFIIILSSSNLPFLFF